MKKIIMSMATVSILSVGAVAGGDVEVSEAVVAPIEVNTVNNSGMYVGLAYGYVTSTEEVVGGILPSNVFYIDKVEYSSMMFQAGYKINEYIAVEGRYWLGFSKTGQDHVTGIDIDTTSDTWGIYVKPMYPVTDSLDVYVLLGYASTTFEYTNPNYDFESLYEPEGFSWGIGASYDVTENVSMFVDYVSMVDETTSALGADFADKIYGINLGVNYRF